MARNPITATSYRARDLLAGDVVQLRLYNIVQWVRLVENAKHPKDFRGNVVLTYETSIGVSAEHDMGQWNLVKVQTEKRTG